MMEKRTKESMKPLEIPLVIDDDLYHNEMICFVLYLATEILSNNQKRTNEELNLIRVFNIISNILSCFKCINQASNFIKHRPTLKELDKNEEMTVIDYYNYHYDVVIHKLSTIRDLSFKLINQVFDLKLDDKKCTWSNISKHEEQITISGVLSIQVLYYHLMKEIEEERNESSHNGSIDIKIFDYLGSLAYISQLKRLDKIPEDSSIDDPLAKGTYYDYLLKTKKKELLERINTYKVTSSFCIHVLTCCMSNKFKSGFSQEFLAKYSELIQKANHNIDTYNRKINKLKYLIGWIMRNDETMESLKKKEA